MSTAEQLKTILSAARTRRQELSKQREKEVRDARDAAGKAAEQAFDAAHGAEVQEAVQAVTDADAAHKAALVAEGRANLLWPEGTELGIWHYPVTSRFTKPEVRQWVCRDKVKVEVVVPGTSFPSNLSTHSLPDVGDVIGRILKKDGTPGGKFIGLARPHGLLFPVDYTPTGSVEEEREHSKGGDDYD